MPAPGGLPRARCAATRGGGDVGGRGHRRAEAQLLVRQDGARRFVGGSRRGRVEVGAGRAVSLGVDRLAARHRGVRPFTARTGRGTRGSGLVDVRGGLGAAVLAAVLRYPVARGGQSAAQPPAGLPGQIRRERTGAAGRRRRTATVVRPGTAGARAHRTAARGGGQGVHEVLRPRGLLQAAHQVGRGEVDVLRVHHGGVEQHAPGTLPHGPRLGRRDALQHLDVQHVGDAAALGQDQQQGHVVEVVGAEAHPQRGGVLRPQHALGHRQEVGVDVLLVRVGRRRPAAHLGLDVLHRQVRALDQAHPDRRAARTHTRGGEGEQAVEGRAGVRQVGLQHDAGGEVVELRFGQQLGEHLEREVQVPVLLHAEGDQRRGAPVARGAVQGAQSLGDAGDAALGVPRGDLRGQGGDRHRDGVDVVAPQQAADPVGAGGGLVVPEHGRAQRNEVEGEALRRREGEVLGQGRVARVDEEVAEEPAHEAAGQRHGEPRGGGGHGDPGAEQQPVGGGEVGGGCAIVEPGQLARGDRRVRGAGDAVDEVHREVQPGRVGHDGAQAGRGGALGVGLPGVGGVDPLLRERHGGLDQVRVGQGVCSGRRRRRGHGSSGRWVATAGPGIGRRAAGSAVPIHGSPRARRRSGNAPGARRARPAYSPSTQW